MSLDNDIHAYFVTTGTSEDTSKFFHVAKSMLSSHITQNNIRELKASEGYPLIAAGTLVKRDVFIFDHFEGDFFEKLQETKALIVGPPCIVACLLNFKPIPNTPSPIYSTAMRDLQITATSLKADEKTRVRTLVHWMGGHYFHNLGPSITHLISNTIKSNKYEQATLNGIPVMHMDWVHKVWERSCEKEDISATNNEFDKYRLPTFYGANITCTGLDNEAKNRVMRVVNENGGTYHRAFRSQLVDIVITNQNQTNSEKYKAALRFNKEILVPDWIFDSERKGFALPTKGYVVKGRKEVSTPTKGDLQDVDGGADHTHLSDISRISYASNSGPRMCSDVTTVNETMNSSTVSSAGNVNRTLMASGAAKSANALLKKATSGGAPHYRLIYEEINMHEAKKAGNFLDGCCIFLSGFLNEEHEKLNRILNAGGATRYDAPHDDVTHIIVGKLDDTEFRQWQKDGLLSSVYVVMLQWLQESIKAGHLVSEANYRVTLPSMSEPDAPSPSSKRTLRAMNHSFKHPEMPIKKKLFVSKNNTFTESFANAKPVSNSTELQLTEDAEDEQRLIAQYSQENEAGVALPPAVSLPSTTKSSSSHMLPEATSTKTNLANKEVAEVDTINSIDLDKLDYFRGVTIYISKHEFDDELYSQVCSECQAAEGHIVYDSFVDTVDYAIVSFEDTYDISRLEVKARNVVTELFVESCMAENKLVPIEYYHKHIPHTANSKPLAGMTIVISIYSGLERDFINSISQLLGATVNNTFVRKERPLLICPTAEGSKYEGAIKWDYPVVNSQWLVDVADLGLKLPYVSYLVGESVSDFTTSPIWENNTMTRAKPQNIQQASTTEKNAASKTHIPEQIEIENLCAAESSTGVNMQPETSDYTPLRNRRVSELAGGMGGSRSSRSSSDNRSSPETPHTPLNTLTGASYNFDFMESVLKKLNNEQHRQCLREIINEMRQNQTPELERIKRQACTPINSKINEMRTPKGIPAFCLTPEYQKRMAEDFEHRWRISKQFLKPDTPIDDIRQRIFRITCETLGVPYDDVEETRHNRTKSPIQNVEVLNSRPSTSTKTIVSTTPMTRKSNITGRTLFSGASQDQNDSSNSSNIFVPATQSPSTCQHSPEVTKSSNSRAWTGKSTLNFDKISFEDTNENFTHTRPSVSTADDRTSTNIKSNTNTTTTPEVKQITDYLKDCETRRRSLKRAYSNHNNYEDAPGDAPDYEMETEAQFVQPFESEQFCAGSEEMVGWCERSERDKVRMALRAQLKKMQHKGKPRFSISVSAEEDLENIIAQIQRLKGEVCEVLTNYDPSCTHYICERPNRGEKMLGCIASGKWTMSISYIHECAAKDMFLDEERFEWGNVQVIPKLTSDECIIASAANEWRRQLQRERCGGAFSKFRVLLNVSERSEEPIKTVLRAGGAHIIDTKPPYSMLNDAHTATYCFVDAKKAPLKPEDIRFLRDHKIPIYSQIYINAYLMKVGQFDHSRYELYVDK